MTAPQTFVSGAAAQISSYVAHRRARGHMPGGYERDLVRFDRAAAELFPDDNELTQRMVDSWCAQRPKESPNTRRSRCQAIVALITFLRGRGETDVEPPELPRHTDSGYIPHAFTSDELARLFDELDSWRYSGGPVSAGRRNELVLPVIYRLIYSAGLRTCEARLLKRSNVDLDSGVMRIVEGKGRNERLVALHPSMLALARKYDRLAEELVPGRVYFFPNGRDGHLSVDWVSRHFREAWSHVSEEPATPYMLRHAYAVENIDRISTEGPVGTEALMPLSKSMGHSTVDVTVSSYYHISAGLAEAMQRRCGKLDGPIPEVF